jgi:hypothetical protein
VGGKLLTREIGRKQGTCGKNKACVLAQAQGFGHPMTLVEVYPFGGQNASPPFYIPNKL